METFNKKISIIDIKEFIIETFRKTISASRSRLVIFCIILFLQFFAFDIVTLLSGHNYPNTYNGLVQKESHESGISLFLELPKYLLLLVLIIKSPAERTRRRRVAKYIVLLGSLYLWATIDFVTEGIRYSEQESEIAAQSFKENSIPIYGKVVFASYKRGEGASERLTFAEKLSARTNGYLVIVQLDHSLYPYPGLKSGDHNFNYYTHDSYDTTFRTNIPQKVPDLSNCQQFIVDFKLPIKVIPTLPAEDKYVKIMFDPVKGWIEMYTDSATVTTPTFDSIPGADRQKTSD